MQTRTQMSIQLVAKPYEKGSPQKKGLYREQTTPWFHPVPRFAFKEVIYSALDLSFLIC